MFDFGIEEFSFNVNKIEKLICVEALSGRCKKDCSHNEPHDFDKRYCTEICSENENSVKCVEILIENYI